MMLNFTDSFTSSLMYKGCVSELPESSSIGSVVHMKGADYVYTGSGWDKLSVDRPYLNSKTFYIDSKISSCPNCGAPINPNTNKCEYCGAYFTVDWK